MIEEAIVQLQEILIEDPARTTQVHVKARRFRPHKKGGNRSTMRAIYNDLLIPRDSQIQPRNKPRLLSNYISVFGHVLQLQEAEAKGMAKVQRDRTGKIKKDADGCIQFRQATVH